MPETFDYIIVGAGAAGCVLANRLSASGQHRVAVLEAGGPDRHIWIKVPAGFNKTVYDPKLNWGYETAPGPHIDGRKIMFPRGKVLGGSGSINGHLYVRGQAADYDTWAQLGCRGWSWTDVLPYFKRAERRVGGEDAVRGRDGLLYIEDQRDPHLLSDAYVAANEALGLKRTADYNCGDQEGTFLYQQMMRGGRRWSPVDAYLRPILSRPNLRVIPWVLAERVVFDGKRATGVRYRRRDGGAETLNASRDVILCGGSINTPHLLQLSGVGDPAWLNDLGVDVVHALPGVGRNFRDHYAVRVSALVKGAGSLNERSHGLRLVGEVIRYAINRKGLLAASPSHAGGYVKTRPGLETPDMQLYFAPASYAGGRYGTAVLDTRPGMTLGASQLRPESTGHVKALSADAAAKPEIQPNYLADQIDRDALLAAMKYLRKLLATKPLVDYVDHENFPGPQIKSDDELMAHARATGSTTYHPVGTCKIGTDPMAVVDPLSMKVIGLQGLRVADASVMPTMVSGNTYAATNMIAEKASDLIPAG
ncbi:GMC family oxidoreductase [Reyranella sp. CPCC 100927]|uniref:GMC family oxidoreductase n=1 Tax=Reyranella sp. CPCC 100927 TaxID=2599616 RepID=UPI0011B7360E|nr:GMC family oxidoreductase N-terminal domain-containing protein [Reyranella sp. CPCC 100927]TWT14028.1 choline dehydrogenase [Reyranella sp. CPCC 100927]